MLYAIKIIVIKKKIPKKKFYLDIKLMLKKEKDIKLVILLTPAGLHFDQIKLCLLYKKDIIVEKPICLELAELKKIIFIQKE